MVLITKTLLRCKYPKTSIYLYSLDVVDDVDIFNNYRHAKYQINVINKTTIYIYYGQTRCLQPQEFKIVERFSYVCYKQEWNFKFLHEFDDQLLIDSESQTPTFVDHELSAFNFQNIILPNFSFSMVFSKIKTTSICGNFF